jgi:hypothetical protein
MEPQRTGQNRRAPVPSRRYSVWFTVPANTHCRGHSMTRLPNGGRNRSAVRLTYALMLAISERAKLSSPEISTIHTPRICIEATLLPKSIPEFAVNLKGCPSQVSSARFTTSALELSGKFTSISTGPRNSQNECQLLKVIRLGGRKDDALPAFIRPKMALACEARANRLATISSDKNGAATAGKHED